MALFRIFKGPEEGLDAVPKHEGYAYFTTDKGNFYIDISSDTIIDGVNQEDGIRVQVNAKGAQGIIDSGGNLVDIDDLMLADAKIEVDQGGTGLQTLTLNAILIGNGTNAVKMKKIDEGALVIGDTTDGIAGLTGVGALYALADGAPQFDILPIEIGGTGATTKAGARQQLEVYSKTEIDTELEKATTMAWATTLYSAGWIDDGNIFTYVYNNADITCGKNGNVPPIITYTSNLEEYSKIDEANATPGTGITFKASKKPEADIGIIITDNR